MKKKELKRLESLIKERVEYFQFEDLEDDVKIRKTKEGYSLLLEDNEYNAKSYEFKLDLDDNISESELIYLFIKEIYSSEINWRSKYIKETNKFLYRKAEQLNTWDKRNNQSKIEKINKEIIERYKETNRFKMDVPYFKQIVSALYSVKEDLDNEEVA